MELAGEDGLVGCVGLLPVDLDVPFATAVEVGWRLARPFWGGGLASEAASAAIGFGFEQLALKELVAYTAACNARSRRVMARLRMRRDGSEDFSHPSLAEGHSLAPHVLYRARAADWLDETLWQLDAL